MAVKQAVGEHIDRFQADFPFAAEVIRLIKRPMAAIIYAAPVMQHAPPHSWVLHVRLPGHLERHFGITRQFLVYCICTRDLQPRDVKRVQALIREGEQALEPTFAMIIAQDSELKIKLDDWAVERDLGITVIPAEHAAIDERLANEGHDALRDLIEQSIRARNFYDERDPVTGDRFFGRGEILRDLERQLTAGRGHVGIFGLRRIGKTSLILELRARLLKRTGVIPIFIDLEATTSGAHAAHRLLEELVNALIDVRGMSRDTAERTVKMPDDWRSLPPQELISDVADAMRTILTGPMRDQQFVLLLDEAESLLPDANEPAPHAVDFFRAIRGVSQETQRLSLVLAGVNATPTESPVLGGHDNPLFGLLSIDYLGPLEIPECDEMIRRVGRKMQIRWDGPAVSVLSEGVGGHPLLARLAASDVVTRFTERPLRPTIAAIQECLQEFHRTHSAIFEQMVHGLRRYYPDELDVLIWASTGETDLVRDLTEHEPALLNHLVGYGVLDQETMSISIPAFDRWLFLQQAP